MQVLEKLVSKIVGRKRDRAETYKKLVEDVAKERERDVAETDEILSHVNKSVSDLEADVARHRDRLEWKKVLDRAGIVSPDRAKLVANVERTAEETRVATERHQAARNALNVVDNEKREGDSQADDAKQHLLETAPPELHAKLRDVCARRDKLSAQKSQLWNLERDARTNAQTEAQLANDPNGTTFAAEYRSRAAGQVARADQLKAQAAELDAQIAALGEEETRIMQVEMLTP